MLVRRLKQKGLNGTAKNSWGTPLQMKKGDYSSKKINVLKYIKALNVIEFLRRGVKKGYTTGFGYDNQSFL